MTLHKTIVQLCRGLSFTAIAWPKLTLLMACLVPLLTVPGLWRLQLRTDGHALVSPEAPETIYDQAVRSKFGVRDQIVILIRTSHPDGIFNTNTIRLVRQLTAELARLPDVNATNITSLATESSFRLRPGTLNRQTLLEPPMVTREELLQLRDDLRRIQLYTGTIVAFDEQSTCILLGAPGVGDRTRAHKQILDLIAGLGETTDEIHVTGAPVAESLLGIHILEDLGLPKALLGTTTWAQNEAAADTGAGGLTQLRQNISRSVGLVPIAIGIMLLVFLLAFRNPLTALLPMPEVGAAIVFAFGLMGYFGVPIYLTIAVMPVLLTAMCVTDEIHIFSRFFALQRERPDEPVANIVRQVANELACPVANSSLTTAIGFISFACSSLPPVQAFGIFTALGVVFSLLWSLAVIPAMLVLIPTKWLLPLWRGAAVAPSTPRESWFGRVAVSLVQHRALVLCGVGLVVALVPFGLKRLVVQDSWINGFDPSSEFRHATQYVNEKFHGVHLLLVTFDGRQTLSGQIGVSNVGPTRLEFPRGLVEDPRELAGARITWNFEPPSPADPPGVTNATWRTHFQFVNTNTAGIVALTAPEDTPANFKQLLAAAKTLRYEITSQPHLRPGFVREIAALSEHIRQRRDCAVGGVIGPADYLLTTRFMVRPSDPKARTLPVNAEEAKLMWDYYRMVRGAERLRQIVDTNYSESVITVFLKDANFRDTALLMRDLRDYERERLAPLGVKLGFAGDVAVSQSLIHSIVTTQLQSLLGSLAGIYILTSLLGRSWRWGFYCVVPSTLAVLINFAVMGWFHIPLGVATSMFAGMTLGLGVDFAIHVLEGIDRERVAGATSLDGIRAALSLTGPAVALNTLAITAGFGVLMLSQVPANSRLGVLVVLGLVNCLVVSLLLLPVLLHWWPPHGGKPERRS